MVTECRVAGQCEGGSEHSYWAQSCEDVTSRVSIGLRREEKIWRWKRGKKGLKQEEGEQGPLLRQWEDLGGKKEVDGHKDKVGKTAKFEEVGGGRQRIWEMQRGRGIIQGWGNRINQTWMSKYCKTENKRKAVSPWLMMSRWGQGLMTADIWTRYPLTLTLPCRSYTNTQSHKHA